MAKNKGTQGTKSTYDTLLSLGGGIEEELKQFQSMSIKEPRSSQYILTDINKECARFLIDGGVITDNNVSRCDKLVLIKLNNQKWVQIFIELKGKNVNKAIQQIESTLSTGLFDDQVTKRRLAHVVYRGSIPADRSDLTKMKMKERLMKEYTCELKIIKSGQQESLKEYL